MTHEAGAVKDDDERADVVQDRGDDRVEQAEAARVRPPMMKNTPNRKFWLMTFRVLLREAHQERQAAQIVVHERDGGAVNGHFAAGRAHGDAHIPGGEGRGVVHAVADDCDTVTAGLDLAHEFDFVLRQAFGHDFFAPDFARHAGGDGLAIAGDHGDAANADLGQVGQALRGLRHAFRRASRSSRYIGRCGRQRSG